MPWTWARDASGCEERGRYGGAQSTTSAGLCWAGRTNASAPKWFWFMTRLGLIAGNGKFPLLLLDADRGPGYEVVVAAIREETFPEIESHGPVSVHWISLGELSKLIDTFKTAGVTRAVMAGERKDKHVFFAIKPTPPRAGEQVSTLPANTADFDEGVV